MKKTKNKLGKFALLVLVLCGMTLVGKNIAFATPTDLSTGMSELTAFGLSELSVFEILSLVLNWLLSLVGIMGVLGFAVSGVMYLTSAGDEKATTKAKNVMLYSIIGVIVAVLGLVAVYALDAIFVQNSI